MCIIAIYHAFISRQTLWLNVFIGSLKKHIGQNIQTNTQTQTTRVCTAQCRYTFFFCCHTYWTSNWTLQVVSWVYMKNMLEWLKTEWHWPCAKLCPCTVAPYLFQIQRSVSYSEHQAADTIHTWSAVKAAHQIQQLSKYNNKQKQQFSVAYWLSNLLASLLK